MAMPAVISNIARGSPASAAASQTRAGSGLLRSAQSALYEGRHHPGFGVEIKQSCVEHHRLQPREAAGQPALPRSQTSLLRQPPNRQCGATQGQGLTGQEPMDAGQDPICRARQISIQAPWSASTCTCSIRGDRCCYKSDQPGPLIEQPQVVGIGPSAGHGVPLQRPRSSRPKRKAPAAAEDICCG